MKAIVEVTACRVRRREANRVHFLNDGIPHEDQCQFISEARRRYRVAYFWYPHPGKPQRWFD